MDNARNLFLNLLARETNGWCFFDVVPHYDENLAEYMRSVGQRVFLRFDLPTSRSVVYFPIRYRSLVGMHVFGDKPALREDGTKSITPIVSEKAVFLLISEYFSIHDLDTSDAFLKNVEVKYAVSVSRALDRLLPVACIKQMPAGIQSDNKFAKRYLPIGGLFDEHVDRTSLMKLLNVVSSYATDYGHPVHDAAIEWIKQYSRFLVATSVSNYVSEGKALSVSLQNSLVGLDDSGRPVDFAFDKGCPYVALLQLPAGHDRSKLEQHLLCQLLSQHLFPLVRAFGVLELIFETEALSEITSVFEEFRERFPQKLSFFENAHIKVPTFLSDWMETDSEHVYSQTHVHNHLINKRYYASDLIRPTFGNVLHKRCFEKGAFEIGIRAFDLEKDLEIIHEWVNQEYAKKFWEMDGPIQDLEEAYIKHLGTDYSHPYLGMLNGKPIFTLELYWAIKDEVGKYYPFCPGDYGFHLLIAPAKQRIPNFSRYALITCMEYFFSFGQVDRIIGEASVENEASHNLIAKVGCEFDKALVLPYKTANLTFLTRDMFHRAVKDVLDCSYAEPLPNR